MLNLTVVSRTDISAHCSAVHQPPAVFRRQDHAVPHHQSQAATNLRHLRLANDPTIRYAILSLHEGVHLNSFKILNGEVVDKEVHL